MRKEFAVVGLDRGHGLLEREAVAGETLELTGERTAARPRRPRRGIRPWLSTPAWASWACVPVSNLSGEALPVGRTLYAAQALQQVKAAPQRAGVGAEELVGRTNEEVAAERLHVDRTVRGRSGLRRPRAKRPVVDHAGDVGDRVDRADGIGGEADGDDFRPVIELALKVIEAERAVGGVEVDLFDDDALFGQGEPRRAGRRRGRAG